MIQSFAGWWSMHNKCNDLVNIANTVADAKIIYYRLQTSNSSHVPGNKTRTQNVREKKPF